MAKIKISTKDIGCIKPRCRRKLKRTHRHHKGHEKLFINIWAGVKRGKTYKELVDRYLQFRPEDVCIICDQHHAEIHHIYRDIIFEHQTKEKIPLMAFSWKQAHTLMGDLRAECAAWLREDTPGMSPKAVFTKKSKPVKTD